MDIVFSSQRSETGDNRVIDPALMDRDRSGRCQVIRGAVKNNGQMIRLGLAGIVKQRHDGIIGRLEKCVFRYFHAIARCLIVHRALKRYAGRWNVRNGVRQIINDIIIAIRSLQQRRAGRKQEPMQIVSPLIIRQTAIDAGSVLYVRADGIGKGTADDTGQDVRDRRSLIEISGMHRRVQKTDAGSASDLESFFADAIHALQIAFGEEISVHIPPNRCTIRQFTQEVLQKRRIVFTSKDEKIIVVC